MSRSVVKIAETVEGYTIYVAERAYAVSKGQRFFILATVIGRYDDRVYLNEEDCYTVGTAHYCNNKPVTLKGNYRLLKKATYIYSANKKIWMKMK